MIEKLLKKLLGEKIWSSLVGVVGGAVSGVATVAATGNIEKSALITGAIGGASAAIIGVGGRMKGEK